MKRWHYASVIDGPRRGLLAGPYATHDEALAVVDHATRLAERADPRAAFYAFGTAGSDSIHPTVFGVITPASRQEAP